MAHYLIGLGDAAANCSKAMAIASKLPGSLKNELIAACCGKSSDDCAEKMAAMAGQVYCMAQTSGACPPCCAFVSNQAAKILMYSLDKLGVGGVFRDYFNLGVDIVNQIIPKGSCNFTPDLNRMVDAAVKAGKAMAQSLSDTWIAVHGQVGIPTPPLALRDQLVQVQKDPEYPWLRIMPFGATPKPGWSVQTITWENLLVHTSANGPSGQFLAPADSSYGSLIVPKAPRGSNVAFPQYFAMQKAHWRCEREEAFRKAVNWGIKYRMEGLEDTYKHLQVKIAEQMNLMLAAKKPEPPKPLPPKPEPPKPLPPRPKSRPPKPTYSDQDKLKLALLLALVAGVGIYALKTKPKTRVRKNKLTARRR